MRQILGVFGGIFIAALVPAIGLGVSDHSMALVVLTLVVATLWIVVLGLPTFFILKRRGWVRWWSAGISGFILGAVPSAVVSWPYDPGVDSSFSAWDGHKMVEYVVHGIPTHAGWVQYFQSSWGVGLLGAACAIVFWLVWRVVAGPSQSSKRTRVPRAA